MAGLLPLAQSISSQAKLAHIFDDLHSASLVSWGQLCDDGCKILLDKTHMYVLKDKSIVLKGFRNYTDGLWDIHLPQQQHHKLFHISHCLPTTSSLSVHFAPSHHLNVIIR